MVNLHAWDVKRGCTCTLLVTTRKETRRSIKHVLGFNMAMFQTSWLLRLSCFHFRKHVNLFYEMNH